jgi:hypothetical protein
MNEDTLSQLDPLYRRRLRRARLNGLLLGLALGILAVLIALALMGRGP